MGRKLRFVIPEGTRTWFYDRTKMEEDRKDGRPPVARMTFAYPGDEYPEEQVHDAAAYVERGQAVWVEDETPLEAAEED